MAPHHRRIKLVRLHRPVLGDQHVADHAQAVHLGVEGAQTIGEFFRQHGDDPAREIHAGSAVVGIDVDSGAVFHIVAHIGNRNQQTPSLGGVFAAPQWGRFAIHRVVKIAGVLTINRDQRYITQVHTPGQILRTHSVWQGFGLGQAGRGEFMWDAVFAHRDFDLHARIVHLAQHFADTSHWLSVQSRRLHQLHYHHLPGACITGRPAWNQDILAIAFVFRCHQPDAALLQETPNDGLSRTLQNLEHTAFRPTLAIAAYDARLDAVFMQDGAHFIGRQVNVRGPVIAGYKSVAVAVPLHYAFHLVQQAAGLTNSFDTIALFPEMPRWRNW